MKGSAVEGRCFLLLHLIFLRLGYLLAASTLVKTMGSEFESK